MAPKELVDFNTQFWQAISEGDGGCWSHVNRPNLSGYVQISIRDTKFFVHRVAYELSCGPIQAGLIVCHRCDNKSCCNPKHLFLGLPKDNSLDMASKHRSNKGVKHPMAKMTEDDVRTIRQLFNKGVAQRRLSEQFNLSPSQINKIVKGQSWTHI